MKWSQLSTPKPKKEGFVFVANVKDFIKSSLVSVRIMGKSVAVFQSFDGTFTAREASCKHQGADLSTMPIVDGKVTCKRHGWQYDFITGFCLNRNSPPLREYEVLIESDSVFVSLFPKS